MEVEVEMEVMEVEVEVVEAEVVEEEVEVEVESHATPIVAVAVAVRSHVACAAAAADLACARSYNPCVEIAGRSRRACEAAACSPSHCSLAVSLRYVCDPCISSADAGCRATHKRRQWCQLAHPRRRATAPLAASRRLRLFYTGAQ